jgi:hypothetical protein
MKKAILHNRLVLLWANPTREKLKKFYASTGIFNDKDDAQNLIKFGAYLIFNGHRQSEDEKPYDSTIGLNNWVNSLEGYILFHVGTEYFLKGVFLYKGYAINKLKKIYSLPEPYKIARNHRKLDASETHTFGYFTKNITKIVDFTEFDKQQSSKNKIYKGKKPVGIISTRFKHPNHEQLLYYLQFSRNKYLHTRRKIPEFKGITDDVMELLNFISVYVCQKNIEALSDLEKISVENS